MRWSRLATGAAALSVTLGAVAITAPAASATASGCVGGKNPVSCIYVSGSKTWVSSAKGGVVLSAYSSTRGYFKVWDSKGKVNRTTGVVTLSNHSYMGHTKWGPVVTVSRGLPSGDKVCAAFFQRKSNGSYTYHSPACETIHG
jgi:hypothetical protein